MPTSSQLQEQAFTTVKQNAEFLQKSTTIYKQLSKARREIRLLSIEPAEFDDENIIVNIFTVSLDTTPQYEAVSYVWGDTANTRAIRLEGLEYQTTTSQWTALRRLRSYGSSRSFWRDAICINQANDDERAQQVGMMSDIYASSQRTMIWLGEPSSHDVEITDSEWKEIQKSFSESPDISILQKVSNAIIMDGSTPEMEAVMVGKDANLRGTLRILELLQQDKHTHELPFYVRDHHGCIHLIRSWFDALQGLYYVALNPWWSRVWIIQEAFLSPSMAQVMVGSLTIPFGLFFDTQRSAEKHDHSPGCCANYEFAWGREIGRYGNVMLAFAQLRFMFESTKEPTLSLQEALMISCYSKTTDLRDQVYGVLGLVRPDERVEINYKTSLSELYTNVTLRIATSSADVSWLLAEATCLQESKLGLPTWCRDFSRGVTITTRLIGLVLCERYQRDGIMSSIASLTQVSPGCLQLQGQCVDIVNYTWETDQIDLQVPLQEKLARRIDEWWNILSSYHEQFDRHTFWKILLWDCWTNEPANSSTPSKVVPIDRTISDRIHSDIIALTDKSSDFDGSAYQLYSDAYRRAFDECRPLLTEKGNVGSGPLEMEDGDHIYRIEGCPIPIVLRQVGSKDISNLDKGSTSPPCFQLVGMCYIEEYTGHELPKTVETTIIHLV